MLRAPFKDTINRSAMEAMRDRWTDEIEEMQVEAVLDEVAAKIA